MPDVASRIAELLNQQPLIVVGMFALSLAANVIQIATYLRDRRTLRREREERTRLAQLVASYEDVLRLAKERVSDQDEVARLKREVTANTAQAEELRTRMTDLVKSAKRAVLRQEITFYQDALARSYETLAALRAESRELGEEPPVELPAPYRSELQQALTRPYQLPRAFVFRAGLLVLFLWLAPRPIDTLLMPFVLHLFLEALFEAVTYLPNDDLRRRVVRYHSPLIFLAYFAAWSAFYGVLFNYLNMLLPLISVGRSSLGVPLYIILTVSPTLFALLAARPGWRESVADFRRDVLPRLRAGGGASTFTLPLKAAKTLPPQGPVRPSDTLAAE